MNLDQKWERMESSFKCRWRWCGQGVLGCNLPLPSHGFSLRTAFQNGWDPLRLLAFFLKQCLDLTEEKWKHVIKKTWLPLTGSQLSVTPALQPALQGMGWSWLNRARQCLTLLFQLIDVSHDGSEKGSLVGVIVHAASHKVSQLLTRRCHWSAPAFVESLFLCRRRQHETKGTTRKPFSPRSGGVIDPHLISNSSASKGDLWY